MCHYRFDPDAFAMTPPGMRFPVPLPPHIPMDQSNMDEHANVDQHRAWVKELTALQQLTRD
jgi:forkhead box protein J2/3